MNDKHKYYAFISYKREDEEWAAWLQHEFEHYRLPSTLNGRPDLPTEFGPIFRDVDELSAGNLPAQIHEALEASAHLIVVCSPLSAKSEWVNKEVSDFIEIGRRKGIDNIDNIFPFIVEGTPHAARAAEECFPAILRDLPASRERIGGNVNETGRDKAFIKTLAGMLRIRFDELWQRYEKEKIEEERRKREERNRLQLIQSRFLAEKATDLADRGDSYLARLLALQALPKRLGDPEDRPYCPEAEAALRVADGKRSAIIRGHTDRVSCAVFSPDGKRFATASEDKTVRVWHAESAAEIRRFTGKDKKGFVAFSPDGKRILFADERRLRYWDIETWKEIKLEYLWDGREIDYPMGRIAAFSPDGRIFAYILGGSNLNFWNFETWKNEFQGEIGGSITSLAFSPDGKRIVLASSDKTVYIWDVETKKEIRRLEGHTDRVNSAAFSPDGKQIVTASTDDTARIWDAETGKEVSCLVGHTGSVYSAAFSPDGKGIVSASYDKTVRIWNAQSGKEIRQLEGHTHYVNSVAFSPDGKRIISASDDNTVRIWGVRLHPEIKKLRRLKGHTSEVYFTTFSPDGKQIVSASWDNTVRIWNVETGKEIRKLEGHTNRVFSAAFSPDGERIVSASSDHTVRIWNTLSGKEIRKLDTGDSVNFATFSPDGKQIVSAFMYSENNPVCIWDTETGEEILSLVGHTAYVSSAAFSPDGKRIVSASADNTVRIWDVETGKEIRKFEKHTDQVNSAAFSPDGKRIVSASDDKTVRIWNAETGEEIHRFEEYSNDVRSAAFSPDGKLVVTADADFSVRIFDVESGAVFQKSGLSWNAVSFSPNAKQLVSGDDNNVVIWEFEPLQELMDRTRERVENRPLTQDEKKKYYLD